MAKVRSGYPRFVRHACIEDLASSWKNSFGIGEDKDLIFFRERHAADDALHKLGGLKNSARIHSEKECCVVEVDKATHEEKFLIAYLQHTGAGISSRMAEDLEAKHSLPEPDHNQTLEKQIYDWFDPRVKSRIHLCNSGMNAFYAAFESVNAYQRPKARKLWISVGWLYLDTLKILDEFLHLDGGEHISFPDVSNTEAILNCIETRGDEIAGLVVEIPTNPLVQTPDIEVISERCKEKGILTIGDPSLVSSQNVDLSELCDIVCCSLTKYAAHAGDVMIGAVSVREGESWTEEIDSILKARLSRPYARDEILLSEHLSSAKEVLEQMNQNTVKMASFLENHPGIEKCYWAESEIYGERYGRIARKSSCPGSIITIKLKKSVQPFYDRIPLPKGPSFGTTFTLLTAYVHLAHYDMLQTVMGREILANAGIDERMLRLSVGIEPIDTLKSLFEKYL